MWDYEPPEPFLLQPCISQWERDNSRSPRTSFSGRHLWAAIFQPPRLISNLLEVELALHIRVEELPC